MPLRKSPACAVLFLVIASLLHAASEVEVDVVVDMTTEGRKIVHPDPAHPAYYLPVVGGFQEKGATVRGEKMPSPHDVVHLVAVALARQGYLIAKPAPGVNAQGVITYADDTVVTVPPFIKPGHRIGLNEPGNVPLTMAMLEDPDGPYSLRLASQTPPGGSPAPATDVMRTISARHGPVLRGLPNLVLTIHWGYLNPQIDDASEPTGSVDNPFYNQNEMLALVGGNALVMLSYADREAVMQAAKNNRYFVILSAYDFPSYQQAHKKVLLWQAKMSVPSNGSLFNDVMATLITAGEPLLGRETSRPKMLFLPVTPEGKVTIGTPVLSDYRETPAQQPPSAPAAPLAK
jgi:hypothetical protein